MRIHDIRRANLGLILRAHSKDSDFAKEMGVDPARLSQLKNGHENIGEKTAPQIEKAAKKPPGWLDIPAELQQENAEYQLPHQVISEEEKLLLENFRALCPDQRAALKTVSDALAQSAPTKKAG